MPDPVTDRHVLAIETADPLGGVLVQPPGGEASVLTFDRPNQHAQKLVPMLRTLLREPHSLQMVLVDRGPGSHTGVRIGLATARMIAWQTGAELLGVSSLEALAHAVFAVGFRVPLLVLVPCRAGHVYAQRFAPGEAHPQPDGAAAVVDVREGIPDEWTGCMVVGAGAQAEAPVQAAVADGRLKTVVNAPSWPTPAHLLAVGLRLASALPREQWAETVQPMYLGGVLAKTRAERKAAGGKR